MEAQPHQRSTYRPSRGDNAFVLHEIGGIRHRGMDVRFGKEGISRQEVLDRRPGAEMAKQNVHRHTRPRNASLAAHHVRINRDTRMFHLTNLHHFHFAVNRPRIMSRSLLVPAADHGADLARLAGGVLSEPRPGKPRQTA